MADAKHKDLLEREYIIPLRREWGKVANYKRARRAIIAIKKFVAKHMKVVDRDINKVKIDIYFNNEIWFRGKSRPPAKVKVKATRDGDIVRVTFAEMPQRVRFEKAKAERRHKPEEKSKSVEKEVKPHEHKEETAEEKKEELEKEKSTEVQHIQEIKSLEKAQKHTTSVKEPIAHRMALKK